MAWLFCTHFTFSYNFAQIFGAINSMKPAETSILHRARWRPDPSLKLKNGDIYSGLVSLETISHKELFQPSLVDEAKGSSRDASSAEGSGGSDAFQSYPENELNVMADHNYKQDFVDEICSLAGVEGIDEWVRLGLHPVLCKYLVRAGYTKPRAIQVQTIRAALHDKSLVIAAETGSGKTLAYLLPALHKAFTLVTNALKRPEQAQRRALQTLIIAPTRELATQINTVMTTIFGDIQKCFRIMYTIVGGISPQKQERFIRERPLILVGTPGRLYDISKSNAFFADTSLIDRVVIDESDKMLQKGRFHELIDLCSALTSAVTDGCTAKVTISSATMSLPSMLRERNIKFSESDEETAQPSNQGRTWKEKKHGRRKDNKFDRAIRSAKKDLVLEIADNAAVTESQRQIYMSWLKVLSNLGFSGSKLVIVDISPDCIVNKAVFELWNHVFDDSEKNVLMAYLVIRYRYPTIIFVKTIDQAKNFTNIFQLLGIPAWCVHASMPQRQRYKNVDRLRDRSDTVLITTDVCARGLDIPHVSLVIQHSAPDSTSSHIHRVGRAARVESGADQKHVGMAISLISPADNNRFVQIASVCGYTQKTMPPAIDIQGDVLKSIKQIWAAASEAADALAENQGFMRRQSYRRRDEKNFNSSSDESDDDFRTFINNPEAQAISHELSEHIQISKARLEALLSRPIRSSSRPGKPPLQLVGAASKASHDITDLLTEHPRELKLGDHGRGGSDVPKVSPDASLNKSRKDTTPLKISHLDAPKKIGNVSGNIASTPKSSRGSKSKRKTKL